MRQAKNCLRRLWVPLLLLAGLACTANDALTTPPTGTGAPRLTLPDAAEVISRVTADLDGDGQEETIVLAGMGGAPQQLGYDFVQLFVLHAAPEQREDVVWHSHPLAGERGEALQVKDINGDGRPEVLSVQALGAAGETLYVLAWRIDRYGFLRPHGGAFEGQDSFGETGVRLRDLDGDGRLEILASYAPAASHIDIYQWNGQHYVYQETRVTEERAALPGYDRRAH
jgi:hypothetical protein